MNKPLLNPHSCLFPMLGSPCGESADRVAKDNVAKYAQVCERHFRRLTRVEQDHYARIR